MKLHVYAGPLPVAPPAFEWEDLEWIDFVDAVDDEEEIDLGDLFDRSNDEARG